MAAGVALTGPLLVTETSAIGSTAVTTGKVVLFVGFGSLAELAALAMLVRLAALEGAVTVSVRFVLAPAARLPRFQKTWLPLKAPAAVALTKAAPAGKLSVTDKLVAMEGPLLLTTIV